MISILWGVVVTETEGNAWCSSTTGPKIRQGTLHQEVERETGVQHLDANVGFLEKTVLWKENENAA